MSSPASPPETLPPPDDASPPFLLPIPLGNPVTPPSPLPLPPIPFIVSSPVLSPPAPPLSPPPDPAPVLSRPAPASSPSPPSLPSIPSSAPPSESPPLISPPAPPALSINPPTTTPELPDNPTAPALPNNPPAPALRSKPPAPELPNKSPAPVVSTKPQPPSSSVPVKPTPTASEPQPPASTKSPSRRRHSTRSKTLPSTAPIPPPLPAAAEPVSGPTSQPVAGPTSQPATGGGSSDDMPLTAEMPAPSPSVPLEVGGGTRPAMAVLPVGANGSSDLQAGTDGGGGGPATVGVSTGIIAGLCVGGVVLVALLVFGILLVICRRKKGSSFNDCGSFGGNSKADLQGNLSLPSYTKRTTSFPETELWGGANTMGGPTTGLVGVPPSNGTFTYEELAGATSGFSEGNLLGEGGFGHVHKGVLPNGKEVAVKRLKMGGQQGEREFRAEVETISQVHHKHLVSLVGYCIDGVERLLVYEFVANKTLEFHLHEKDQPVMDWSTRLKIAIGSAKGLAYLHEDCNPTIIHRDIKASNILLDFNFEVKVADFGLAKIFSNTNSAVTHVTTRVVGTFGYLAPEYASSGKVTDKSDVYSYGVMLLELITGRPPINTSESDMNGSLVNWARPLLPQAIEEANFDMLVDPRLKNNYNVDEMANMVACAAACVRLSAWRRPRMSQVIRALEGDLSPSDLDDGVRPGHSSMHSSYESSDFDDRKYIKDMRKLRMTLSNNGEGDNTNGLYSDNTSEYGLQPSISSADSHELYARSFAPGRD